MQGGKVQFHGYNSIFNQIFVIILIDKKKHLFSALFHDYYYIVPMASMNFINFQRKEAKLKNQNYEINLKFYSD